MEAATPKIDGDKKTHLRKEYTLIEVTSPAYTEQIIEIEGTIIDGRALKINIVKEPTLVKKIKTTAGNYFIQISSTLLQRNVM